MAQKSSISWTDATWNPTAGCTAVAPGCAHCYAATMSRRLEKMGHAKYEGVAVRKNGIDEFTGKINFDERALMAPLKWRKPRRIFVNSMSDLFHRDVPFEFVDKVFSVMLLSPQHTFQVLTKRPGRALSYMRRVSTTNLSRAADSSNLEYSGITIPDVIPNVEMGTSVSCQMTADNAIPKLIRLRRFFKTLFISAEPLLGQVNFSPPEDRLKPWIKSEVWLNQLDLVIFGGESGPGARGCDIDWIRSGVRQCRDAGVKVFVKQLGANVIDTRTTVAERVPDEECWPDGTNVDGHRVRLRNKKGEDQAEMPPDMRVREYAED